MTELNFSFDENPRSNSTRREENNSLDVELWESFKDGNESAFILIYEKNFESLFSFGSRLCGDQELVKDAIQEVFIYLRNHREGLGKTTNIKFYLFKCLKRQLIKDLRKQERNQESILGDFVGIDFSPEERMINSQLDEECQRKLSLALDKLSPRKKELIYYFYFEQLSYEEIRELLGLENVKSVRNLLYKTLNFLKEIF